MTDNTYYCRYKLARKIFRKTVKIAQNQYLCKHCINLDKLKHSKPQKFWKNFRTLKRPSKKRAFNINKKLEDNEISNEFAHHFNYLLNTPRVELSENDTDSYHLLEENTLEPTTIFISPDDIKFVLLQLKCNKSRDPNNIRAEHFMFSNSESLYKWLSVFFNHIIESKYVPTALSTSIIIPLVKSYKKSLSDPNNYRGISLIPILTKILELLIIHKYPQLTKHHKNQFGFKQHSSTIHASYTVKETVNYYNKNNSPVFICSLDAEKAFDSCNWDILFSKLHSKRKTADSNNNNPTKFIFFRYCFCFICKHYLL